MSATDEIEEHREALQALAESDLRSAKYAEILLDMTEEESSDSAKEPISPDTQASPDTESNERSIFAY